MNKGFSLLELLIVLLIASILVSFSYPSYRHYITRAHRLDGQTALLDLATRMETYFTEQGTYQTARIGQNKSTDLLNTNVSSQGWYILSIVEATQSTYTVQATPKGSQARQDLNCQSLTFNHLGVKGITMGPAGQPKTVAEQCW